jgi:predicted O-linked N-acetylglucosamine transferase (SPINDLY family)
VRQLLREGGVEPDRLGFVASVSRLPYLQRYHDLDIWLDPFPFNGTIATLDALWMGSPIVTLAGRTAVDRAGVSILSNLGMREFVAQSRGEYGDIAVRHARDLDRLASRRPKLRSRMEASPFLDGRQFASDVEAAVRSIWKTWCGEGPG